MLKKRSFQEKVSINRNMEAIIAQSCLENYKKNTRTRASLEQNWGMRLENLGPS